MIQRGTWTNEGQRVMVSDEIPLINQPYFINFHIFWIKYD
jgi:hypothetical protein